MISSRNERGAVFVDRDGVVCENRPDHVKTWDEFEFIPGAVEALASLTRAGARIFIATNQGAIGRGLMSRRTLDEIHERMLRVVEGAGARIEAVLVCPHHPDDGCACRKPKAGLFTEAAKRFRIDLAASFVVGDAVSDVEAATAAGCETVLVRTGRGAEAERDLERERTRPAFVADDLVDAVLWILVRRAERMGAGTEVKL